MEDLSEKTDRIRKLEDDVKDLTKSVGSLESDVKNVARNIDNLSSVINSLSVKLQSDTKTNWSTLAAWATVIIALMSAIGYLATQPVNILIDRERYTNVRQWDRLQSLDTRLHEVKKKEAVTSSRLDQRIRSLTEKVNAIQSEQLRRTQRVYKLPTKY